MKKVLYWITFGILLLDQTVKFHVVRNIDFGKTVEVIPHFFSLTHVKNTGGAWSLFREYPYLLVIISALFLIGLNHYLLSAKHISKLEALAYGCTMGGVLGNFIDRVLKDGVVDYFHFQFGSYSYPIFNIADIAIVLGVGFFFVDVIRGEKNENRSRSSQGTDRSVSQ